MRERALFRRLAIFAGGWSLQLAETVCSDDDASSDDIVELLSRLVEKSMVVMETRGKLARLRLLAPIRHFALELLQASGEADTYGAKHAAALVELAEQREVKLAGPEVSSRSIGSSWSTTTFVPHSAGRSTIAMAPRHCAWRPPCGDSGSGASFHQEACEWLDQALSSGADAPLEARGNALNALAMMHWSTANAEAAQPLAEEALRLCSKVRDVRGTAWAYVDLGMIAYYRADPSRAIDALEHGLEFAHRWTDTPLLSLAATNLGRILLWHSVRTILGSPPSLQEGLALAEQVQSRHATSQALGGLRSWPGVRGTSKTR